MSLLCLIALLLTACGNPQLPAAKAAPRQIVADYSGVKCAISTEEFNYGKALYTSPQGKQMPYELRGVLSKPQGEGKYPLAVIIHGSHANTERGLRFDTGFSYLTEALAQRGYAAVALDVQPAYLWEYGDNDDDLKIRAMVPKFLAALAEQQPQLDLDRLVLIGHSRGGATVQQLAAEMPAVRGLIAVAPADFVGSEQFTPNLPACFIVPEYDGDVSSLDGYRNYENFCRAADRTAATNLVLLRRGNHNYFNSQVTAAEMLPLDPAIFQVLQPLEQRHFLAEFCADFLDQVVQGDSRNPLFDFAAAQPQQMYGLSVLTLSHSGQATELDLAAVTAQKAQVKIIKEHNFYQLDEAPEFNLPAILTADAPTPLLRVQWQRKNAQLNLPLTENLDFRGAQSLTITLAGSPADRYADPQLPLHGSVYLTDAAGKSCGVELTEQVLSYPLGEKQDLEIEGQTYQIWSMNTPLAQIRIPLALFSALDLQQVVGLTISFGDTAQGALMIKSIEIE